MRLRNRLDILSVGSSRTPQRNERQPWIEDWKALSGKMVKLWRLDEAQKMGPELTKWKSEQMLQSVAWRGMS